MDKPHPIIWRGVVVAHSKNLRGLLDYARKHRVAYVSVHGTHDGGAAYYVRYNNGAEARGEFADLSVAVRWFRTRAKRSWDLSTVRNADDYWTFYVGAANSEGKL